MSLCLGEDEEAENPEAMRRFNKAKRKKAVVSILKKRKYLFCDYHYILYIYILCLVSAFKSLPRIDLDNYSALPLDEGDEDREAGIVDEDDDRSDLDIGHDPASAGKLLQMNPSSNYTEHVLDDCFY